MVDYKKIAWDAAFVYLFSYVIILISFAIRVLYARKLTVVDYGLFFGLFGFFIFFAVIRDFGFNSASLYYAKKYIVEKNFSKVKTLYIFNQGFSLFMSFLIAGIIYLSKSFIIDTVYHHEGNIVFIFDFFLMYWIIEDFYKSNLIFFESFHEQRTSKFLEFLTRLFILLGSFIGFFLLDPYKVPPLAYLFSGVFISIISTIWFYYSHPEIFSAPFYRGMDLIVDLFHYGRLVILGGVSTVILAGMDSFLIQYFLGAEKVGYYVTGGSASDIVLLLVMPITVITVPLFTQLWFEGKKSELSAVSSFLFNNILLFVLPIASFFFTFSSQIIDFVYGANYGPSSIILKIFCISVLIRMYNNFLFQIILAMGKPGLSSKITLYAMIVNLVLAIILINAIGIVGAALAAFIGYGIIFGLSLKEILKSFPIKFDFLNNAKILLSSLLFIVISFSLRSFTFFSFSNPYFHFLVNGGIVFGIGSFFYIVSLFLLRVITKDKIRFVVKMFNLSFMEKYL